MTIGEKISQLAEEKANVQKKYSEQAAANLANIRNNQHITNSELEEERRLFTQFNQSVSEYSKVVMLIAISKKKLSDKFEPSEFSSQIK